MNDTDKDHFNTNFKNKSNTDNIIITLSWFSYTDVQTIRPSVSMTKSASTATCVCVMES